MYEVQTWDEDHNCIRYYNVVDANSYDDTRDFITHLHPDQKVISVTKRK